MTSLGISRELQGRLVSALDRLLAEADRLYSGFPPEVKREGVQAVVDNMLERQLDALKVKMPELSMADLQEIDTQLCEFMQQEIAHKLS